MPKNPSSGSIVPTSANPVAPTPPVSGKGFWTSAAANANPHQGTPVAQAAHPSRAGTQAVHSTIASPLVRGKGLAGGRPRQPSGHGSGGGGGNGGGGKGRNSGGAASMLRRDIGRMMRQRPQQPQGQGQQQQNQSAQPEDDSDQSNQVADDSDDTTNVPPPGQDDAAAMAEELPEFGLGAELL